MIAKGIRQFVVTEKDAHRYNPPAHTDTTNLLYLAKGALGSKHFEVVVGMPRRGGGGNPHFHEEAEQIVFVLAGHGESEIEGARLPIGPGTLIFHPPGQLHREIALSDDFKVLVIYSPGIGVQDSRSFRIRGAQRKAKRAGAGAKGAETTKTKKRPRSGN